MPDPIVLQPGDQQKIISQPPQGSQWHVQVDGADVYLSHNNLAVVREGTNVRPGDRVQVKNLEGTSYYAKNPSTNSANAEIEVSEASAFLDFLNPFTQPRVVDDTGTEAPPATSGANGPDTRNVTKKQAEAVEHEVKTVTTTVASGSSESTRFYAPTNTVMDVLSVSIAISPTGGSTNHTLTAVDSNANIPLLEISTDGSNGIQYEAGIITSTVSDHAYPSTEAAQVQSFEGMRIDESDGLQFNYNNSSGSDQTNDLIYKLVGRQIEVA